MNRPGAGSRAVGSLERSAKPDRHALQSPSASSARRSWVSRHRKASFGEHRSETRIMAFDGSRAEFYRDQACRLRALAKACKLSDIKEQLEHVAEEYETLAHQVEAGILPL